MNETIENFTLKLESLIKESNANKREFNVIKSFLIEFVNKNKIYVMDELFLFTKETWEKFQSKKNLRKLLLNVHYFSIHLIKNGVIHPESVPFPRSTKLTSPNKLTDWFLKTPFPIMDDILKLRDRLKELLKNDEDEYEKLLYIYLAYFTPPFYSYQQLSQLRLDNYFMIEEKFFFVIKSNFMKIAEGDRNLEILIFDVEISRFIQKKIKNILPTIDFNQPNRNAMQTLFEFSKIFQLEKEESQRYLNYFCERNGNRRYDTNTIRNAIQLEIQINHSPLKSTLVVDKTHPKISLSEINYLFKGMVPSFFLKMEEKIENDKNYFADEEADDLAEIEEHLNVKHEVIDIIRLIQKTSFNDRSKFAIFCDEQSNKLKDINKSDLTEDELKIVKYLIYEISKLVNKLIAPKTFKQKLAVLTRFCFQYVLYSKVLSLAILINIKNQIYDNEEYENSTKANYINVLDAYFVYSYKLKLDIVISNSIKQRTLVFKGELDIIVEKLIQMDLKKYNIQRMTVGNFYKSHMNAVFILLAFYSGIRLNELRSRLLSDFYKSEDHFVIDVNRKGFKQMIKTTKEPYKSLKNSSAKRRIKFNIFDSEHKKIIDEFYNAIHTLNKKYLFVSISQNLISSKPVKESKIQDLNKIIQDITGRKIVLHSLRHSFVSYKMKMLLNDNKANKQKDLSELCNTIGHSEPRVTISHYCHLDLLPYL